MKTTLQDSVENDLAEKIAIQADNEKRSISNMVSILLEEALEKRNGDTDKK